VFPGHHYVEVKKKIPAEWNTVDRSTGSSLKKQWFHSSLMNFGYLVSILPSFVFLYFPIFVVSLCVCYIWKNLFTIKWPICSRCQFHQIYQSSFPVWKCFNKLSYVDSLVCICVFGHKEICKKTVRKMLMNFTLSEKGSTTFTECW